MDHTEAIRIKATEQYLLGELSGNLRDEFEEHFMGCGDCARDVRAGAAFFGNARDALSLEPSPAIDRPASQKSWLAAFLRPAVVVPALVILLAVVSFQGLVIIPRMRTALSKANMPRSVASFSLLNGSSRGEPSVPIVVKREEPFTLYLDVPPEPAFPLYTLDVENASGASVFLVPVSAEEARNSLQVLVPPGQLAPGDYLISIHGVSQVNSPSSEVGRLRFSVRYAD